MLDYQMKNVPEIYQGVLIKGLPLGNSFFERI